MSSGGRSTRDQRHARQNRRASRSGCGRASLTLLLWNKPCSLQDSKQRCYFIHTLEKRKGQRPWRQEEEKKKWGREGKREIEQMRNSKVKRDQQETNITDVEEKEEQN